MYVVKCKIHHKAYVGQTTNMVRVRISKHLAMVKSFKRGIQRNMGYYFNGCGCSINNLVWAPLDYIGENIPKRTAESMQTKNT